MSRPTATGRRRSGTIRCAVYTRKSSEEGLEQEFNSLQAQREACEAFIKSQRHEGWACLPDGYDDGGLSGATMERPALQQLLGEIQARRVDIVVVYKVDRLTRSLGYQVRDRGLVVVDSEAETVRYIFRRYAELGSIRLFKEELDAQDLASKSWMSASGRHWGGKPFARGALYLMLQNRIYRGEIVHKERSYPGEHTPIIDQELWGTVQGRLAGNAAQRNAGGRAAQPNLLAGMLFDGDGNRMTPSHAVKKGTRYRYYASRPLITKDQPDGSAGLRIPAAEI